MREIACKNRNNKNGFKYSEKACKLNDSRGCYNLGVVYAFGKGVDRDLIKAENLWTDGCKLNEGMSCYMLASFFIKDEKLQRELYKNSEKSLLNSCNKSSALACTFLGNMYERGLGVNQNYLTATKFYEQACNLNSSDSCEMLGFLYNNSLGVKQDERKAIEYWEKSCSLKNGSACFSVAKLYYSVFNNERKSLSFYKKSCDYNYGYGCFITGLAYKDDNKDELSRTTLNKAFQLFYDGCKADEEVDCYVLFEMYREGYAVEKNMIKASEYCEKSCKLGLEVACEELKKLPQTPIIKKLKGKNLN